MVPCSCSASCCSLWNSASHRHKADVRKKAANHCVLLDVDCDWSWIRCLVEIRIPVVLPLPRDVDSTTDDAHKSRSPFESVIEFPSISGEIIDRRQWLSSLCGSVQMRYCFIIWIHPLRSLKDSSASTIARSLKQRMLNDRCIRHQNRTQRDNDKSSTFLHWARWHDALSGKVRNRWG